MRRRLWLAWRKTKRLLRVPAYEDVTAYILTQSGTPICTQANEPLEQQDKRSAGT